MTIKDLARRTGYSVGTVSRVLNDHPNVSEKARSVIAQAVAESGFQLNVNAKQLKQSRATSVLMVVKGRSNELFSELVERIQSLVSQTQYPLYVDYLDEDDDEVLRAIQLCREKKPLGILFLGGNSRNFRENFGRIDIPCVLVTNSAADLGFPNLSSVSTDSALAARSAVETLIGLGHRRIVVVGGDLQRSDTSRLRCQGCLAAFQAHGVPFDQELDYQGVRFSYQGGYNAAQALLRHRRPFTALFAVSDVMAIGAIRALRDSGLEVPGDVSVMGFDGLPLGAFLVPQLATVGQNVEQMARRSVELLLDAVEGRASGRHVTIPFVIYPRQSIRALDD